MTQREPQTTRTIVDDLSMDGSRGDLPREPLNRELSGRLQKRAAPETTTEVLRWVRNQIVDLCEATEDDPSIRALAERDTETKIGAFARGRIREAAAIRNAMCEVIRAMTREIENG